MICVTLNGEFGVSRVSVVNQPGDPAGESSTTWQFDKWIGLRDNSQENPIFKRKIDGFRLRFSLKQIR
jgi:hypothetical protein